MKSSRDRNCTQGREPVALVRAACRSTGGLTLSSLKSDKISTYSDKLLEHFRRPRHAGPLEDPHVRTGTAGSRRVGTRVCFQVAVADGRIADAGYLVFGPPYAIAACSLTAERLIGAPATPESAPAGRDLAQELDVPVERTGVVLIVEDALRAALTD